jgi:hypothetical protein
MPSPGPHPSSAASPDTPLKSRAPERKVDHEERERERVERGRVELLEMIAKGSFCDA